MQSFVCKKLEAALKLTAKKQDVDVANLLAAAARDDCYHRSALSGFAIHLCLLKQIVLFGDSKQVVRTVVDCSGLANRLLLILASCQPQPPSSSRMRLAPPAGQRS